ncbi:hypothetical protein PR048_022435 [Dryococelus australis]|uniref:Uncharacterized protein n=1 Tax=Dryococelus australis TaxID=614101 RepID=A0ABQ9H140_9NEOP|nr:hypothetical protein PR048_022435 [Dryococelus australis]
MWNRKSFYEMQCRSRSPYPTMCGSKMWHLIQRDPAVCEAFIMHLPVSTRIIRSCLNEAGLQVRSVAVALKSLALMAPAPEGTSPQGTSPKDSAIIPLQSHPSHHQCSQSVDFTPAGSFRRHSTLCWLVVSLVFAHPSLEGAAYWQDDTDTRASCTFAPTCTALNWRAVFPSNVLRVPTFKLGPRCCSGQTTCLSLGRTGFDSRRGSTRDFCMWESCRRCLWSAGFLGDLPFPPLLHSGAAPYSSTFTLKNSRDLNVKRRTNLSTPLHFEPSRPLIEYSRMIMGSMDQGNGGIGTGAGRNQLGIPPFPSKFPFYPFRISCFSLKKASIPRESLSDPSEGFGVIVFEGRIVVAILV